MAEKKYVYDFDEAYGLGKELLGGKGAGLAEMTHIGVPIPQGFTVTTEACAVYYDSGKKLPDFVVKQVFDAIAVIEKKTGKTFGGKKNPLLVSVRSGARVSMPGMMDTILNLGLNDAAFEALASETSNKRFAADCYRRFILMFTNIAKGHPRTEMDKMLEELKESRGYKLDTEITEAELLELVKEYKAYYKKVFGEDFPSDPKVQLIEAVSAVFRSWDNPRANVYRKMNEIPYSWGTAVNVQSMAFGNKGETSGTGVGFSRNPATGEKGIYAEYLPNAQGEDVVAGIRTPLHIDYLKEKMPAVYDQFMNTVHKLEDHYKDMQDMEFTVEDGKLYFLQTRNGKRTAQAGLKIANDLMDEGKIDEKTAVLRIDPRSLDTLLHPSFDVASLKAAKVLGVGLPASPGAGVGTLAFTAEDAEARHLKGEKVILVRAETSPEDIVGMNSSEAILTMRGGMTSHAAVVARGMGKTCVVGCATAVINEKKQTLTFNGKVYGVNDVLSVNGSTGEIYEGAIKLVPANLDSGDFGRIMKLADKFRKLHVRTNADTPRDAKQARAFGAEGIGLCRTEHMFFDADRIFHMRKMILSEDIKVREAALDAILPHQRDDFHQLYLAMEGEAVNIRLLDPPLHEFLPQDAGQIAELAKAIGVTVEHVNERIEYLHEFNPMMGHRGCRLDVTYPEIGRMQARAIIEAAILASKDLGKPVEPEIMIPLTFGIKEFRFVKQIIVEEAEKVLKEHGVKLNYHVGTMIEIPRAAITATSIAKEAEFFSFGTNDLTQMTFGFSRDDATKFLPDYYANRILEQDPFATIDQEGVGRLVRLATKEGKEGNAELHVGVCGEHGGDPTSVEFFHNSGLDYVSCSPFRVPVARLAAAQAQIKNPR
ncbi:MAG: pyruvate, phosphate dikinase [Bacilli bacterium]|jgi:pyruvate,orthophosphate dikinase|nr:pyruvate, phosphate dikinase [Bacilli bacterium]MDD3389077.1 pyruvate, phosphate dikinase [Bacilli bacterium]MDD4344716.1 pyruvate, phosphate dikinase [Bacilli bacterium]MDD4520839.1 pyruvate, phosphate dikinase [Bacilli bacterium]MDY0399649.1 pyruvate, phosphate dikinase [Bacilli bacterium]